MFLLSKGILFKKLYNTRQLFFSQNSLINQIYILELRVPDIHELFKTSKWILKLSTLSMAFPPKLIKCIMQRKTMKCDMY